VSSTVSIDRAGADWPSLRTTEVVRATVTLIAMIKLASTVLKTDVLDDSIGF
jgi:hypothetical protein